MKLIDEALKRCPRCGEPIYWDSVFSEFCGSDCQGKDRAARLEALQLARAEEIAGREDAWKEL